MREVLRAGMSLLRRDDLDDGKPPAAAAESQQRRPAPSSPARRTVANVAQAAADRLDPVSRAGYDLATGKDLYAGESAGKPYMPENTSTSAAAAAASVQEEDAAAVVRVAGPTVKAGLDLVYGREFDELTPDEAAAAAAAAAPAGADAPGNTDTGHIAAAVPSVQPTSAAASDADPSAAADSVFPSADQGSDAKHGNLSVTPGASPVERGAEASAEVGDAQQLDATDASRQGSAHSDFLADAVLHGDGTPESQSADGEAGLSGVVALESAGGPGEGIGYGAGTGEGDVDDSNVAASGAAAELGGSAATNTGADAGIGAVVPPGDKQSDEAVAVAEQAGAGGSTAHEVQPSDGAAVSALSTEE